VIVFIYWSAGQILGGGLKREENIVAQDVMYLV